MGHPFAFIADANALLPLVRFIEGAKYFISQLKYISCVEEVAEVTGIEPMYVVLETTVLPLNYTSTILFLFNTRSWRGRQDLNL